MADTNTVCAMCGDIGFPDKLFQCMRCLSRFQHSYCSNYYEEPSATAQVCDWCLREERASTQHMSSSRKHAVKDHSASGNRAERSGDHENGTRSKNSGSSSSSRHAGRRVLASMLVQLIFKTKRQI